LAPPPGLPGIKAILGQKFQELVMTIDLSSLFKKALKDERKILRPHFFPATGSDPNHLVNEETYVRLRLARMHLKDRRVLFQTKYPVVNTSTRFAGREGKVEVQFVARPDLAGNTSRSQLDEIVTLDQTILGPILYRGGDLELMLGLYAAPADDWAKRFISLAEGVSKLTLNVPLTTAISMAGAIKKSLEDSMSGDGLDLKLGLDMELKENITLAPGHLVMINAPDKDIDRSVFQVENGELMSGGKVYTGHDYIVLAIEVTRSRSDWQALGYGASWKKLLTVAAEADNIELVKTAYLTFSGVIQASDDLSLADRNAILTLAQERITTIRKQRANTGFLDGLETMGLPEELEQLVNAEVTLPESGSPDLPAPDLWRTDWLD
jgi:hypothetical protein